MNSEIPVRLPNGAPPPGRKPRADGVQSRQAILHAAASLATTRGFAGLSIGDLAEHIGMSKSGLYAHFKSKEDLELATIDTAIEIFDREVLQPVAQAPAGVRRLRVLVDAYLDHLERKVFPGGCFFAAVAAELDARPGPARDRVLSVLQNWIGLLTQCVRDAQAAREIDPAADVAQTVFEVQAMLVAANFLFAITNDPLRLTQARRGVDHVLARLAVRATSKKKRPARSQGRL
ncbi:MAG TPA: TetR/AcrR family transcriptional regulator [Gemmataceae bacterium]|nr:TetR/AcrR family transcriptional regulator [Gemmataceae bacterium]